jgi:GNAT superfamily N-acetyltransferase
MAWVLDVIVRPDLRGQGQGKLLVERLLAHAALRHVRRVGLATRDAHTLYERFGFQRSARPDRIMELSPHLSLTAEVCVNAGLSVP